MNRHPQHPECNKIQLSHLSSLSRWGRGREGEFHMNFFQRRKILRSVNYLDLTPVRMMDHQVTLEGKADILLPRFKKGFWREVYSKTPKGEFIFIHLDEIGSSIWLLIDGKKKVAEICSELQVLKPEKLQPPEETERRVTDFLSLLYNEKYISFREILTGR